MCQEKGHHENQVTRWPSATKITIRGTGSTIALMLPTPVSQRYRRLIALEFESADRKNFRRLAGNAYVLSSKGLSLT